MKVTKGKLYLIPSPLGMESDAETSLPQHTISKINLLSCFIVEELKTARRFLRKLDRFRDIDNTEFYIFNEHCKAQDAENIIAGIVAGRDMGMISEAGLPCVADPGSSVVAAAHRSGIQVVPLPGSSSMVLALMASGFNGQQFSFHGYLPAEAKARNIRIKQIENIALQSGYSQIFIETPYRNDQMIKSLIENCKDTTMLCVASNLTLIEETVTSLCIAEWKNINKSFNKQPSVFILSAAG